MSSPTVPPVHYDRVRLRKLARHVRGETVIDVGYAQHPNPHLEGREVVGYDLVEMREPPAPYTEHVQGDVSDITERLSGRRFDTVVCAELIEHVENPYQLLRDLRCLLPPDGRLVLTTPNPLGFPVVLVEYLGSKRWFYERSHLHYFLPRWVRRMLDDTGFALERTVSVGWWLPRGPVLPCPKALSYQLVYVAGVAGEPTSRGNMGP